MEPAGAIDEPELAPAEPHNMNAKIDLRQAYGLVRQCRADEDLFAPPLDLTCLSDVSHFMVRLVPGLFDRRSAGFVRRGRLQRLAGTGGRSACRRASGTRLLSRSPIRRGSEPTQRRCVCDEARSDLLRPEAGKPQAHRNHLRAGLVGCCVWHRLRRTRAFLERARIATLMATLG